MRNVLSCVLALGVTVLFVFGIGCDLSVAPEGVDTGFVSAEAVVLIGERLEGFLTALDQFASDQVDVVPQVGIEVFGNIFAYPVFVAPIGYPVSAFKDAEALETILEFEYADSRLGLRRPATHAMVSFWIGGGPTAGHYETNSQVYSTSAEPWIGVGALVAISLDYGDGSVSTEYHLVEFAVVLGPENEVSLKYVPILVSRTGWYFSGVWATPLG